MPTTTKSPKTKTPKTAETDLLVNATPVEKPKPKHIADVDDITAIALAKLFPTKELFFGREDIKPGDYKFKAEFKVVIEGLLRKGEEYDANISNKIDWTLAFAVVMSMLNEVSAKRALRMIELAHRANKHHEARTKELVARIKPKVEDGIQWLKNTTKEKCSGKTTFHNDVATITTISHNPAEKIAKEVKK